MANASGVLTPQDWEDFSSPSQYDTSSGSDSDGEEYTPRSCRVSSPRSSKHAKPMRAAKAATNFNSFSGSRKKLRDFLGDLLDAGEVEGLTWLDRPKKTFRIPWKHANKRGNGYVAERDSRLTMLWAINTQKYDPTTEMAEPSRWKTNFRCALNSLRHSIVEVENREARGYKVYRFDDTRRGRGRSRNAASLDEKMPLTPDQNEPKPDSPVTGNKEASIVSSGRSIIKDMLSSSNDLTSSVTSLCTDGDEVSQSYLTPAASLASILDQSDHCMQLNGDVIPALLEPQTDSSTEFGEDFFRDINSAFDQTLSSIADMGHVQAPSAPPTGTAGLPAAHNIADYLSFCSNFPPACPLPVAMDTSADVTPSSSTVSATTGAGQGGLYVSVNYRHNTVAGCEVRAHGCRLHSGRPPHAQQLSHEEQERLYGHCKLQPLALPTPPAGQRCLQSLQKLIGRDGDDDPGLMVRGLCIEVEGDDIYATRLCPVQVYYGCTSQCNREPLARGQRTCIFRFRTFQDLMIKYQSNPRTSEFIAGQPPPYAVQLGVGQAWGPDRLLVNNLLTLSITHQKAQCVLEEFHAKRWAARLPLSTDQLIMDCLSSDDETALKLGTRQVSRQTVPRLTH